MCSVDCRPSQPQSLRMLKAPTGLPMQVRDLLQQLASTSVSIICSTSFAQYRAAAQGVRQNLGQDLLRSAPVAICPSAHHDDLVRQGDDALLVGDDDHGGGAAAWICSKVSVSRAKLHRSMPASGSSKIISWLPGQNGGDLDALDLAAGEGHVHLPVQIVVGAQAHLGQVLAALVLGELVLARGQGQQVCDRDALEAGGLLEAVADAQSGPLRDARGR